jgi:hypothetical protein
MARQSSRFVRQCGIVVPTVALILVACGERKAPPPPDAAPAVVPAARESTATRDTLVGDSVMARDTISVPQP